MMKKAVAYLFFLSLFLGAIALVAPGFIDWSKHKDKIVSQLEPYIARKIDVGGKVSFRILPNPQIVLEDVTLANIDGAKAPQLMKLKQLEARMKLGPLLQGKYEIETINLDAPELHFETLADGTTNWTGVFAEGGGAGPNAEAVRLSQVSMTGGTLHYLDHATGTEWQVDNLNLATSADTLAGPYRIKGDMRYKDTVVGIEAGTGKYERGAPVPLNIAFTPAENMPQVKFNGVADFAQGLGLQGEVSVAQGTLGSLFDSEFLNGLSFMAEPADITAMLNLKTGEAALTDIKGKIGKKGDVKGSVSAVFVPGKKPEVTADLETSDLKVTGKPGFIELPAGFTPHLKVKARSVTFNGTWVPGMTAAIDGDDKEWVIKELRIDLPGKSKIRMAGVVTPKTKYAAYSIQVNSEDAQKMLGGNLLPDSNILKSLGATGLVKKTDLTGSLGIKGDDISLFDINGKINETTGISGVLNIKRGGKTPAFDAILNLDKVDVTAVLSDEYAGFMQKVMASDAALTIHVKDFTKGSLTGSDFVFKGKVYDGVLAVENMSGTFGTDGNFDAQGKIASLNPLAGMDMDYSVKVSQLGGLSGYGIEIPPPLWGSNSAALKGHVKGDAKAYTFTADGVSQGGDVSLSGTATAGNQGTYSYVNNVEMKNASWAQIGLPVDKLFAADNKFSFSAKLNGTRSTYQFDNIKAGDVTGTLGRRDGKYVGDLTAPEINFDRWLWEDWKLSDALELHLKSQKMVWRSNDIANAELQLTAAPDDIKVTDMKGELWGGAVSAETAATRKDGIWKGTLKGTVANADLQQLAELMEMKGFTLGQGDITMNIAEDSKNQDKNWFNDTDGDINIKASSLKVHDFSPRAAGRFINDTKGSHAENLAGDFVKALRSEDTTYRNVDAALKIADAKITIEKLRLQDADAVTTVTGAFDLQPETFRTKADIQLKGITAFPSFAVNRSGEMGKAADYSVGIKPVEIWLMTNATPEPVVVVPDAATDAPQQQLSPDVQPAQPGMPQARTPDEEQYLPPATTPPAPDAADDAAGSIINNIPIETEELRDTAPQADAPPPETAVQPETPATVPATGADGMKGVLDRLNAMPPEPDTPDGVRGEQPPEMPPANLPPAATPRNDEILE